MCECVDFHMCSLVLVVGVCSDFSQMHEGKWQSHLFIKGPNGGQTVNSLWL